MMDERLPLSKLQQYILSYTQGRVSAVSYNERESVNEGQEPWDVYDSLLSSYAIFFDSIIPGREDEISPERKMLRYLTNIRDASFMGNRSNSFTGVELMGSGSELFSGFSDDFFTKSAGITLNDLRSRKRKQNDQERNHTVIPGDINSPEMENILNHWRGNDDINLIIIRPVYGLNYLPDDEFLLFNKIAAAYRTLAPHGMILTQIPEVLKPYKDRWIDKTSRFNGLSIDWDSEKNVARIEKVSSDVPEELPSLTPRDILQTGYRKRLENIVFPDY